MVDYELPSINGNQLTLQELTDRLDKVPKKYRDDVIIKEQGKNNNISTTHDDNSGTNDNIKSAPAVQSQKLYNGKTLAWWISEIKDKTQEIVDINVEIEKKQFLLESLESNIDYMKSLNSQKRDLQQRLRETRSIETGNKSEARAIQLKIIKLTKDLKRPDI